MQNWSRTLFSSYSRCSSRRCCHCGKDCLASSCYSGLWPEWKVQPLWESEPPCRPSALLPPPPHFFPTLIWNFRLALTSVFSLENPAWTPSIRRISAKWKRRSSEYLSSWGGRCRRGGVLLLRDRELGHLPGNDWCFAIFFFLLVVVGLLNCFVSC